MLEALQTLVASLPQIDTDEDLNGGEAIDILAACWPEIKAAILAAKGEV